MQKKWVFLGIVFLLSGCASAEIMKVGSPETGGPGIKIESRFSEAKVTIIKVEKNHLDGTTVTTTTTKLEAGSNFIGSVVDGILGWFGNTADKALSYFQAKDDILKEIQKSAQAEKPVEKLEVKKLEVKKELVGPPGEEEPKPILTGKDLSIEKRLPRIRFKPEAEGSGGKRNVLIGLYDGNKGVTEVRLLSMEGEVLDVAKYSKKASDANFNGSIISVYYTSINKNDFPNHKVIIEVGGIEVCFVPDTRKNYNYHGDVNIFEDNPDIGGR